MTKEQLQEAIFSFAHLDHSKGELPRDKLPEFIEELEGIEVNKAPEAFANMVFGAISRIAKPGETVEGRAVDLAYIPFVDEFISAYLYRDEPYDGDQARHLLPYLETLKEVAEWAIWDADDARRRGPLLVFSGRIARSSLPSAACTVAISCADVSP